MLAAAAAGGINKTSVTYKSAKFGADERSKETDLTKALGDFAGAIGRFYGYLTEACLSSADTIGQKRAIEYVGSSNDQMLAILQGVNGWKERTFFHRDDQFRKDLTEAQQAALQMRLYKGGNGKSDFTVETNNNGVTGKLGIQLKSAKGLEWGKIPNDFPAGGFGMSWALAFKRAPKYAHTTLNVEDLAKLLYSILPYDISYKKKDVDGDFYFMSGGDKEKNLKNTSIENLTSLFEQMKEVTKNYMIVEGILGSGQLTEDSSYIHVINGVGFSSLQLAIAAMQTVKGYELIGYNQKNFNSDKANRIKIQNDAWEGKQPKKGDGESRASKVSNSVGTTFMEKKLNGTIIIKLSQIQGKLRQYRSLTK